MGLLARTSGQAVPDSAAARATAGWRPKHTAMPLSAFHGAAPDVWDFQAVGPPGLYPPVARRALATWGRLPRRSLEAQTLQAPQKIPGPQ